MTDKHKKTWFICMNGELPERSCQSERTEDQVDKRISLAIEKMNKAIEKIRRQRVTKHKIGNATMFGIEQL